MIFKKPFLGPLLFLMALSGLCALDLRVNQTSLPLPSRSGALAVSFSLEGQDVSAYSLLECLPLMEEIYSLEIHHARGLTRIDTDFPEEYFGEAWFIPEGGGWNLLFRNNLYTGVTRFLVQGARLDSRELTVWTSWEGGDELKAELQRFAALHDLTIEAAEVPNPDSKLISLVRGRGRVPDLIMIQSSAVEDLIQAGAIQNLDYLVLPDLIPQGKEAFTLNGRLWGVPFYFDTQVLLYHKDLIDLAPGPWSLADFEAAAASAKARNLTPAAWNAYSSNWLIPFQIAFGKETLLERDGTIIVDDQPTRRALEYIIGLEKRGFLVPRERDAMDALFIQGETAMILTGSYAIPYFTSLGLNFGIKPYPRNGETGRPVSPLLDFKAFALTRHTRVPVLARRVLQHLAGRSAQERFSRDLAKIPVRPDLFPLGDIDPDLNLAFTLSMEEGTVIPPQRIYRVYKNHLWKLIRFALSGRLSVEEVLRQGQRLMDNE
jgi:ABC-type glycerol-3-phosphate transport system substrate-binding protein